MYRLKIHTSGSLHQNTQLKNPASSGEQDRDLLTPHTSGDPEPPPQTWGLLPRHAPRPLLCFHSITKHHQRDSPKVVGAIPAVTVVLVLRSLVPTITYWGSNLSLLPQ